MTKTIKEIWKPVKGYEGIYEISNFGNVKNIIRNKLRTLSRNKDGYVEILLSKKGTIVSALVHRLVAEAFVPNPDRKPEINHKDYNKANNFSENLEWVTRKENVNHSDLRGRRRPSSKTKKETHEKKYHSARFNS